MPDINQLRSSFFIGPSEVLPAGSPAPDMVSGSKITHLIDGAAYFSDLSDELAKLTAPGSFVYLAGWLMGFVGGKWTSPGGLASLANPVVLASGGAGFDLHPPPNDRQRSCATASRGSQKRRRAADLAPAADEGGTRRAPLWETRNCRSPRSGRARCQV